MAKHLVYLRIPTHEVWIVNEDTTTDLTNFTLIGEFEHEAPVDRLEYIHNHVIWHHVRDIMYHYGITDVNAFRIYKEEISDAPTPNPDPDPVELKALTIAPNNATVGQPYNGNITGKTASSVLALSGAGAAGLSINGSTVSGTPTAAGSVTITETLTGATNTPRQSAGVITVVAAGPVIRPFSYPAPDAKYHLDFAGQRYTGGVQPDDTTNANDGRFFRQIVQPATPYYAERANGSLRRWNTGTALRITDRGLLIEPQVDYTTRALYSNDMTNAAWVKDGVTATKDQVSRSGVAGSASRLTATKDNATIIQTPAAFAAADQTMYADLRPVTGSDSIDMTIDGVTWTEVKMDKPRYDGYGRYKIPRQNVTNPVYGFRLKKAGDVVDVAFVTSDHLTFETSPFDTSSAVRRRPYDRPSTSIQGGTTTSVSSGLMDFLAEATEWGVYVEWDSLKPDHFLFGQILRPYADGSVRFSTDDTDVKGVKTPAGLTRLTVDRNAPLKNKAIGWVKDGKCYVSVNGSDVVVSSHSAGGPYTALDHKDLGSNGAGSVNMAGCIQQLVIFEKAPSNAEAKAWTTL